MEEFLCSRTEFGQISSECLMVLCMAIILTAQHSPMTVNMCGWHELQQQQILTVHGFLFGYQTPLVNTCFITCH
jgi:hypothetical protein